MKNLVFPPIIFDFLLNLKNEINKSNTDLISSDFKYFDQIEDILSSSKNLIDFLELNIYDQELFHSLVELSILEDFNDEFIKIFDNLNRNLSFTKIIIDNL